MSNGKNTEAGPGDRPNNEKSESNPKPYSPKPTDSLFALETAFPETEGLLKPYVFPSLEGKDVVIALDTNTLLLPFDISSGDLKNLEIVYTRLKKQKRLVVPGRALREFIKHRDRKLAELITRLNQRKGNKQEYDLPSKLVDHGTLSRAEKSIETLRSAKKAYDEVIGEVVDTIRSWRGNDPVTAMYSGIFDKAIVFDIDYSAEARTRYATELRARFAASIPPGFKDKGKDDEGIGDFLIWKSLLEIGASRKCDMAFVTGEEKSDWFTRSDNSCVFPRVELVGEYSRVSGGKSLRLLSLHELLKELKVEQTTVVEVERAEEVANAEIRVIKASGAVPRAKGRSRVNVLPSHKKAVRDLSKLDALLFVERDDSGSISQGVSLLCNWPTLISHIGRATAGEKIIWQGIGNEQAVVGHRDVVIVSLKNHERLLIRFDFSELQDDVVILEWSLFDDSIGAEPPI